MSRSRTEILRLRESLEKSVESNSNESVLDILHVLKDSVVTSDLIKDTKIGRVVHAAKKKYATDKTISDLAKEIIQNWKQIYEKAQSQPSQEASLEKVNSPTTACSVLESNELTDHIVVDLPRNCPDARKKIINSFVSCFESAAQHKNARAVGYGVESTINDLHPFETDIKGYQSKARKLLFNLKKNEDLRLSVLDGVLSVHSLVHMPSSSLATQSVAESRSKASADAHDASRSDWITAHRDEIMEQNGIDPSNGTEFKCRKCRQTKTTMTPVQTRSADEPMTLFINCLTCGFHWKQY